MSNVQDCAKSFDGENVLTLKGTQTLPVPRPIEARAPAQSNPDQPAPVTSRLMSRNAATGRSKRLLMIAAGAILSAVLLAAGYLYWDYASHFESTDDAFVAARQFSVAPRVAGYVANVPVTDNQHVVAGDIIVRIDDRDFRAALEQAEAQVANAAATVANVDAQIAVQQAQVSASEAQVEQAQAALTFAKITVKIHRGQAMRKMGASLRHRYPETG